MNVTPGAVSRQISALEQHLGIEILERSSRGVVATPQGTSLAKRLSGAFSEIAAAVEESTGRDREDALTVNVYPTFAIQWLVPRLADFQAIAPDVDLRIRIRPSLNENRFDKEEISVAVCIGLPEDPLFTSLPLFRRRFVPVCSPNTFNSLAKTGPDILYRTQIYYSDMHINQWKLWLTTMGMDQLALPQVGIRFENSSLAYQAAREGTGFVIAQPALISADLESRRLIAPFGHEVEGPERYWVSCRAKDMRRTTIALFMKWLSETAAVTDRNYNNGRPFEPEGNSVRPVLP
jgi:LysR family glycine cleavage system transcriptional activator